MRKIHFTGRAYSFLVALSILTFSCISESETPLNEDLTVEKEIAEEVVTGGENLRKGDFYRYQEKFSNSIFPFGTESGFYLPGTGVGNATFIGKSLSFINQKALDPITTEGAPVSLVFAEELAALGITNLSDDVHSVTVDKKGNALFFSSGTNNGVPVSEDRVEFEAEVTVVGGMGIFENASGSGKVTGFYNPYTGAGESSIVAELMFK